MAGTTPTNVTAFISIYIGSLGLDWSEKRHTVLGFKFEDNSPPAIVHAAGSTQDYRVEMVDGYDPTTSRNVVGTVFLGTLLVPVSKDKLMDFLQQTPVNNTITGWNCQNWVGDAMDRMLDAGYITKKTWNKGLDAMTDYIADAKDEHLR